MLLTVVPVLPAYIVLICSGATMDGSYHCQLCICIWIVVPLHDYIWQYNCQYMHGITHDVCTVYGIIYVAAFNTIICLVVLAMCIVHVALTVVRTMPHFTHTMA